LFSPAPLVTLPPILSKSRRAFCIKFPWRRNILRRTFCSKCMWRRRSRWKHFRQGTVFNKCKLCHWRNSYSSCKPFLRKIYMRLPYSCYTRCSPRRTPFSRISPSVTSRTCLCATFLCRIFLSRVDLRRVDLRRVYLRITIRTSCWLRKIDLRHDRRRQDRNS
jgi:hypothetical protein